MSAVEYVGRGKLSGMLWAGKPVKLMTCAYTYVLCNINYAIYIYINISNAIYINISNATCAEPGSLCKSHALSNRIQKRKSASSRWSHLPNLQNKPKIHRRRHLTLVRIKLCRDEGLTWFNRTCGHGRPSGTHWNPNYQKSLANVACCVACIRFFLSIPKKEIPQTLHSVLLKQSNEQTTLPSDISR